MDWKICHRRTWEKLCLVLGLGAAQNFNIVWQNGTAGERMTWLKSSWTADGSSQAVEWPNDCQDIHKFSI